MEEVPDYSRWQRTQAKEAKSVTQKSDFPTLGNPVYSTSWSETEKRGKKIPSSLPKDKDPSVLTLGTWSLVENESQPCRILQMLIKSKKVALGEMEGHYARLLEKNRSLVESIKQMDKSSWMYARDLLEQYQVTEKSTISMQEWNQQEVERAKQDLREAEEMVEKRLRELQRELYELDSKLQASQEKLQMLRNYKDKEYPGKVLRIAQLQRELHRLREAQQDEMGDLEKLRNAEVDEVLNKVEEEKDAVLKSAVEEKMKHFPVSLMKTAAYNCVMRKDIQLRKQIIKELRKDISDLLEQQLHLIESQRDARQQIFADVLLQRPKCTPDMEVVLDIPLQEKVFI